MGSGIAESAASAGIDVTVYEPTRGRLTISRPAGRVGRPGGITGKVSREDADAWWADRLYDVVRRPRRRRRVLEAVSEDPREGQAFQRLDEELPNARFLGPTRPRSRSRSWRHGPNAGASGRPALLQSGAGDEAVEVVVGLDTDERP